MDVGGQGNLHYSLLYPESASILLFIVFFFGNPVLQRGKPASLRPRKEN